MTAHVPIRSCFLPIAGLLDANELASPNIVYVDRDLIKKVFLSLISHRELC